MPDWNRLLTDRRLCVEASTPPEPGRDTFDTDLDRIIWSSHFRRLSGRPKAHPGHRRDDVRDRLTHTLETSRVARTLAARAADVLVERGRDDGPEPTRAAQAVSAAAAARDFGTPCFGALGEELISDFFRHDPLGSALVAEIDERQAEEFRNYDRDAQSFRILSRLQGWRPRGGLQLTCATLAIHARDPHPADDPRARRHGRRRYGYHHAEADLFAEAAEGAGLPRTAPGVWTRHPLSPLVDAADGICGRVVDVEDAAAVGLLDVVEVEDLIMPLIGRPDPDYHRIRDRNRRLTYLRSKVISRLVEDVAEAFADRFDDALAGSDVGDLVLASPARDRLAAVEAAVHERSRDDRAKREEDLTASRVIPALLEDVTSAMHERETSHSGRITTRSRMILRAVGDTETPRFGERAEWMRSAVDFVAGCTDRHARRTVELLRG